MPIARNFSASSSCARLTVTAAIVLVLAATEGSRAQSPVGPAGQGPPGQFVPGPPAEEMVADVRIVGNRTAPLPKIVHQIHTRPGRPFNLEVIQADVRRLNQTRMFVTVRTYSRRVPEGVIVVFEVVERPTIQYVKFIGNEVGTKTLRTEAKIEKGEALDPFAIEQGRRAVEDYYHEHGYSKARVTLIEGGQPDDPGVIFLVDEGLKQRIFWTYMVGNTIVSADRLRNQIESTPGIFWLFKNEVDRKKIDEDMNRLTAYYRSLGYFRARVGRELVFNEKQNWLTLTFVIDEGPRHYVRNLAVVGNKKFGSEDLIKDLKLKSGAPFNQADMNADLKSMQDKYGSLGYVFADVNADPRILEEPGKLDLVYTVKEGARYTVGKLNVQIKGDPSRTKLTAVLDQISLRPGDIVDMRELHKSEIRMMATGIFCTDMKEGIKPKIAFSPPDKETEVADESAPARPRYRGQSPDDQVLDLTVQGTLREADRAPQAATAAGYTQSVPAEQTAAPREARPMTVRYQYTPDGGYAMPDFRPQPVAVDPQSPPQNTGYSSAPPSYVPQNVPAGPPVASSTPFRSVAPDPTSPYNAGPAYTSAPATANPSYQAAPSYSSPSYQTGTSNPSYQAPPAYVGQLPPPGAYQAPATPRWVSQPSNGPTASPDPGYGAPSYPAPPPAPPPPPPGTPPGAYGALPPSGPPVAPEDRVFAVPDPTRPLDLAAEVKETETGRLMVGVGVNSDAGLVGNITIDERNFDWSRFPTSYEDIRNGTAFRGGDQQFRLEAVPGTVLQRYTISFREPHAFDTDFGLALSGYYYDRIYTEWTEQRTGGSIALQYQLTHDLSSSVSFRGEQVTITNPITNTVPELNQVVGHPNDVYGFGAKLAHETRDSAFLPTQGHLYTLSFEQVVGTYQYPHAELDLRRFFTLYQQIDGSGRHVLSLLGRFGVTGDATPIYDNYYEGGFSTIRGFAFRGVSPLDQGVPVGGHVETLASAEYMFPITSDDVLRGVFFVDTGTVEPSVNNWSDNYRVAPGFGLRITVPALGPAPIALDLAFPIAFQPGDRISNFSFFIGLGK